MEHPSWVASGLKKVGVYYEGVVENAKEVLERHNWQTITTYGTRTSSKPNCGYSVIAEFIVQSEDSEHIREAINILKSWNPKWKPKTFMTDYSEAESIALQSAFPGVNIYLCDFHREQAWERWVRDHKHGLTHEGEVLLSLLRACAWAPSSSGDDTDSLYLQAVKNLKEFNIWKTHMTVQQWLTTKWLSIPEVLVKITNFQLII